MYYRIGRGVSASDFTKPMEWLRSKVFDVREWGDYLGTPAIWVDNKTVSDSIIKTYVKVSLGRYYIRKEWLIPVTNFEADFDAL